MMDGRRVAMQSAEAWPQIGTEIILPDGARSKVHAVSTQLFTPATPGGYSAAITRVHLAPAAKDSAG